MINVNIIMSASKARLEGNILLMKARQTKRHLVASDDADVNRWCGPGKDQCVVAKIYGVPSKTVGD